VAWETRQRGGRYYTRSRRSSAKLGGRVLREYVGSGPFAELVAEADRVARAEREAQAMRDRWEREKLEALIAPALELSEAAEILTEAHLIAGGFRRHKGEWRRARKRN
jgi:hypothetical protein